MIGFTWVDMYICMYVCIYIWMSTFHFHCFLNCSAGFPLTPRQELHANSAPWRRGTWPRWHMWPGGDSVCIVRRSNPRSQLSMSIHEEWGCMGPNGALSQGLYSRGIWYGFVGIQSRVARCCATRQNASLLPSHIEVRTTRTSIDIADGAPWP